MNKIRVLQASLNNVFSNMDVSRDDLELEDKEKEEEEEEEAIIQPKRRLLRRSSKKDPGDISDKKGLKRESRSQRKKKKKELLYYDEMDPYDSDPGEAYRKHCMQLRGTALPKACLRIPATLKKKSSHEIEQPDGEEASSTSSTLPPSPAQSEADDILAQTPVSLPSTRVRYSIRSSVGDGAAVQPTGLDAMENRELRPNGVALNTSHWSDKGARSYMEDRYAIEDMGSVQVEVSPVAVRGEGNIEVTYKTKNRRLKMPLTWFAVFDGHGGDKASQYCADWLSSYVRQDESFPYDLGYSMKKSFSQIDEDFIGTCHPDGTTACAVSLVGGRRVVCANTGDSRAIVVRKDGSIVRLSRDHKPGMPDETRRITELGGKVIYWGRWRVEGLLAVSRSIGDASLKPYVTAEPEVCEYDIGRDDWFLVLASDGVWDVLDNEEVAHVVIATSCVVDDDEVVIDTDRFRWAARNLCEHSKACGSTDNISAICVDLQSCGNSDAWEGRYTPRKKL